MFFVFADRARFASAVIAAAACLLPVAANAASPLGVWSTGGDKSHIQIYKCGAYLCGKIVWLKSPNGPDGKPSRDKHNPDPAKRGQTIVGLQILSKLKADGSGAKWVDGRIYDPENGKTFNAQLSLGAADTLKIRGYEGIPMLDETRTWKRVK